MSTSLSNEQGVQSACRVDGNDADDCGPSEIFRPGEDHGGDV